MLAFIENPQLLINEFNDLIKDSQRKTFMTVGLEIQKEEIKVLRNYQDDLNKLKKEFVSRNLENEANLVFCIENTALSIEHELEMLINIKEDDMASAWGHLVNAQVTIAAVIRNHPFNGDSLDGYVRKLAAYEQLLFPAIMFSSVGGFIKQSSCSICNEEYGKCDHLRGKVYMGEMCCQNITEMDLEEVSMVENPANKHCRVLTIQVGGKTFDILTLREQEDKPDTTAP